MHYLNGILSMVHNQLFIISIYMVCPNEMETKVIYKTEFNYRKFILQDIKVTVNV